MAEDRESVGEERGVVGGDGEGEELGNGVGVLMGRGRDEEVGVELLEMV